MKKLSLLKTVLLLCALVVGSGSVWAQTDYSASYTGNITLSTSGGSNASTCTVSISSTAYDGIKAGTSSKVGAVKITVPKDTKYLHLHVAAWNGETTSLVVTPDGYSSNIALTANSGISGNSPFTFGTNSGDKGANSSDHYKVITFTSALASNTDLTFTASGGKRFVVWGVYSEAESSDPSSNASFTNTAPSISYPATKTYSQAPTTAGGYNGTISYSMTANTAGATINSSTGLVTVTQGGSVTVKAIAAAVPGSYSASEATYTLTVNDTRSSLGDNLAWSAASASVTYGAGDNVFPTLTNTQNVDVTYTSSNSTAATIDENTGAITLKDYTGNTTISAIFAGNDDYLAKTVTYTLNVSKAPFAIKDGVFDFVEAAGANEDYGSGVSTTDDGNYYVNADKTWTAGNVTMVTSGKYRWWYNGNTLRFYYDSSSSTASSLTLTAPTNNVITKVVFTGGSNFSANVGTLSDGTWTGASNSVTFTYAGTSSSSNVSKITVTYTTANQSITPAYAKTTYVTPYAMDFTNVDGLKAYVATAAASSGVTMTKVEAAVPAGTPLLLIGTAGTGYNVPVAASASAPETNYLEAGDGTTEFDGSTYDYILYSDGKFYQIGSGTVATDKAYLHLTEAPGARALDIIFDDGETTGISAMHNAQCIMHNEYFDLQGRRIAQPTKGLYIVNGKKVVIK